jgi:GNAT superfamily N-acetyltransferase
MKILRATEEHFDGIEKIHLKYFAEIGEKEGCVKTYLGKGDRLSFVALNSQSEVMGYIISSTNGQRNYFEWFGVKEKGKGIAQALLKEYFHVLKKENVTESVLATRNRFKDAIVFYIKAGYEIAGMFLGRDGDLMVQFRKFIN